jgi:flagellar hook assembly protein FlgD
MQKVAIKTRGVASLSNGPVNFAVNATAPAMVQLRIYDVRGRLVAEPLHNSLVTGSANVTWDGTDLRGQAVSPGTYFYRAITAGEAASTGHILILR